MRVRVEACVHAADGMTDKHLRWLNTVRVQHAPEIGNHVAGCSRSRRSITSAAASAIVATHTRFGRERVLNGYPALTRCTQAVFQHHRGAA